MVMMDTDKKLAQVILERVKPNGKTEDVGKVGDESASPISEGERAAAEEMIAAFHAKDAVGLVEAFKAMLDVIEPSQDEEEEEAPKSGFMGG